MMIFEKVIMHHDVTSCVICISNEVEYLEKGVTKILPKRLHCHVKVIFAMQPKNVSQNFVVWAF